MPCGVCMVCTAGAELTGHKTLMDDMKVSTTVCKCHCVYELFLGVHEALCNSHYRVSNLIKDIKVSKNSMISVLHLFKMKAFGM